MMEREKDYSLNKHSVSFVAITVLKTDDDEEEQKEYFKRMMENKPHNIHIFTNENNGEYLYYDGKIMHNLTSGKERVDFTILAKTIKLYIIKHEIDISKRGWKVHYAFIYKLIKEGRLGNDSKNITIDSFIKMMNEVGIDVGRNSNIQAHMPDRELPSWIIKDNAGNRDDNKISAAVSFAHEVLSIYFELKENQ